MKLDQKYYGLFKITKEIEQRVYYKMNVWTDIGQGQGQNRNGVITWKVWIDIQGQGQDLSNNYQSTARERYEHVTWKLCDIGQSSLKWSGRTQNLEGSGRVQKELGLGVMSRDNGSSWYTYGVHMYSRD